MRLKIRGKKKSKRWISIRDFFCERKRDVGNIVIIVIEKFDSI